MPRCTYCGEPFQGEEDFCIDCDAAKGQFLDDYSNLEEDEYHDDEDLWDDETE